MIFKTFIIEYSFKSFKEVVYLSSMDQIGKNIVTHIIFIIFINLHHGLRFGKVHPIYRIYLTFLFLFTLVINLSIYVRLLNGQGLHYLNFRKYLIKHHSQKLKAEANWNKSLYSIFLFMKAMKINSFIHSCKLLWISKDSLKQLVESALIFVMAIFTSNLFLITSVNLLCFCEILSS